MAIELTYENRDAVPAAFQADEVFNEIFTVDDDGKVTVSGVTGMKTQADVDTVSEALRKERNDHKGTKDKLKPWGELNATETLAQLDRIAELEAANGGKLDDEALNKIVEGRLDQKTGPLNRQIETLSTENATFKEENEALKTSITTRDRNDVIRSHATDAKAHATATPDIESAAERMLEQNEKGDWITKSGIAGLTPGLDVKGWMREMQKLRPHWWPESEGGGALGGSGGGNFGGKNPWSAKTWNMTEQGKIYKENSATAEAMAKAAGTTIGGPKPAK